MSLLQKGYFLEFAQGRIGPHILGGSCQLDGAISPNSGRPLMQMASLDTTSKELRAIRYPLKRIPLLYGWSCAISDSWLTYRVGERNVELIDFCTGPAYDDFPYENYPMAFGPVPVVAVRLTESQQHAIAKANRDGYEFISLDEELGKLFVPHHQIGGEPYIGHKEALVRPCRNCDGQLIFVAAIGNHNMLDGRGFMGNDLAQLLYYVCDRCHLILADNISS